MASLRQLSTCIGLSGTVSVLSDFFGFFRGQIPPDPTGAPVRLSLIEQAQRLKNPHFHLNVTAVGVDNFTDSDNIELDYAIFKIRNIYAQVGVGVGRVLHFSVSVAQANGLDSITTTDGLSNVSNSFVVHNNGIDVHVPFSLNVPSNGGIILGQSPSPGPCEGKDAKGMNASVVGLFGSEQTARSFARGWALPRPGAPERPPGEPDVPER